MVRIQGRYSFEFIFVSSVFRLHSRECVFFPDACRYGSRAGFCDFVCTCLIFYARLAIGGPFLLGDTTVAEPMKNGQIQVDGQLALTAFPS